MSCESAAMSKASEQVRRISVRLSPQLKATIERAAASRGQSLNQFLIATLAEGANDVLAHVNPQETGRVAGDSSPRRNAGFVQCNAPAEAPKATSPSLNPPVIISLVPYSGSRAIACPGLTFGL